MKSNDEHPDIDPVERRTETERHWDIVCLTIATLATGVFGAVVVLSGIDEFGESSGPIADMDVYISIALLFAAGLYFLTVTEAARTVFPPQQHRGEKGLNWKRIQASSTVSTFLVLVLLLGAMIFVQTLVSVHIPWLEQRSTPVISLDVQETWGITHPSQSEVPADYM